MPSETIRNPHTDQLLSPENSALFIIDYQRSQVSSEFIALPDVPAPPAPTAP